MILIDHDLVKEQGKRLIPFPDANNRYEPMFYLEDGKPLTVCLPSGKEITNFCTYIDPYHFKFGSNCYHKDEFAELNARNGNVCRPSEQVTDLSLYRKIYADRGLVGEDGKLIPYRAVFGIEPDRYGKPEKVLSICPEAALTRQVAYHTKDGTDFYSVAEASELILPALDLTLNEARLITAIFDQVTPEMEKITQAQWNSIPDDYKGVYINYNGKHPEWEGRKTAFLPGHGTKLFIEGVSFVIDDGKDLSQASQKASQPFNKHDAIVHLAVRLDNFMYNNNFSGYQNDIGLTLTARSEYRAHLIECLMHAEFSPMIDTLTAMRDESLLQGLSEEVNEVEDLIWSLKNLDDYIDCFIKETGKSSYRDLPATPDACQTACDPPKQTLVDQISNAKHRKGETKNSDSAEKTVVPPVR